MSEQTAERPVRIDARQHFWPQPTPEPVFWMTAFSSTVVEG
jgi:hypothetical protein